MSVIEMFYVIQTTYVIGISYVTQMMYVTQKTYVMCVIRTFSVKILQLDWNLKVNSAYGIFPTNGFPSSEVNFEFFMHDV